MMLFTNKIFKHPQWKLLCLLRYIITVNKNKPFVVSLEAFGQQSPNHHCFLLSPPVWTSPERVKKTTCKLHYSKQYRWNKINLLLPIILVIVMLPTIFILFIPLMHSLHFQDIDKKSHHWLIDIEIIHRKDSWQYNIDPKVESYISNNFLSCYLNGCNVLGGHNHYE